MSQLYVVLVVCINVKFLIIASAFNFLLITVAFSELVFMPMFSPVNGIIYVSWVMPAAAVLRLAVSGLSGV